MLVSLVCVYCFLGRVLDLKILASARAPISSLSLLAAQSFEVSHDFCIDSVKGVSLSLELGLDCSQALRYHWISRSRSLSPFNSICSPGFAYRVLGPSLIVVVLPNARWRCGM